MRGFLGRLVPVMALFAVPSLVLAAGKMAEACSCWPLCCPHCWL